MLAKTFLYLTEISSKALCNFTATSFQTSSTHNS